MSVSRSRDEHTLRANARQCASEMLAAIERRLLRGLSDADLAREYETLSHTYRAGLRTPDKISPAAVGAYAAARLPATLAVNVEVLVQLRLARRQWQPRSLLDVGAGLGTAAWAATSIFPSLQQVTFCEDSQGMVEAGRSLAADSMATAVRDARWVGPGALADLEPSDLVIGSYVLGEQPGRDAVEPWWRATSDTLVVIEPGTPAGAGHVMGVRSLMIRAGAMLLGPCPQAGECPLHPPRWCHFSVRVDRSRVHRAIKGGRLDSEDEPYSYIAATRDPGPPPTTARVISPPLVRTGHVRLELCTAAGAEERVIAKSDPLYRQARKLRWGDNLDTSAVPAIAAFVEPHLAAVTLRRVTLSGTPDGNPVRRAVIRPVELRGRRVLQVVLYDDRRATTSNVATPADPTIVDVLRQPFRNVAVALADEILEGRVSKQGRLLTSRTPTSHAPADLAHDRRKNQPITPDALFLEVLGLTTGGRVKPSRQAKFRQINDFIRLFDTATPVDDHWRRRPLRVLDLGCGNAYLTFAVYDHLIRNRQLDCAVVGVDRDQTLIARNTERAALLGWDRGLQFEAGDIKAYEPDPMPDVVLALHACDTASDHALASAVRWNAEAVLVAPCCHHHVQTQLRSSRVAPDDALLIRDAILRERFGDVATDAARAAILRILGFDVDVVQFVDPEHTPRNTMIRAVQKPRPFPGRLVEPYEALKARWGIAPLLGDLLEGVIADYQRRP